MRVYITRRIPTPGIELLKEKQIELEIWDSDEPIPHSELVKVLNNKFDGLFCMLTDTIDAEVLDAAGPRLKAIGTMSVGYEHLDMLEINKRSIVAANCSTASSDCVSEYCVTLVLALARRIIDGYKAVKAGEWTTWKPMWLLGFELIDKTVGILGLGRIGFGIAQRLKAFKVKQICYTDMNEVPYAAEVNATFMTFEQMLPLCDIICISCNLTDTTRGLFNMAVFEKMKNTAILINVSRGGVINHDDLYIALRDKKIAMAAVDVTVPEPLPVTHQLMSLDNCLVTPHVASSTWEARNAMSKLTAENILTILGGNEPVGTIRA